MAGKLAGLDKQVCNIAFGQSGVKNKSFWGAKNQQVLFWYCAWWH